MKKLLHQESVRKACVLLFMLAIANTTYAQSPAFLPLLQASEKAYPVLVESINSKVSKNFSHHFKDATNVKWFAQGKRHLVKFNSDDLKCQSLFSKNGALLYTIKYGIEKHLPSFVKTKVKFNYCYYDIRSVIQVNEANREIWIVVVEDDQYLVTVKVEGNQLNEADKTKKNGSQLLSKS